MITYYIAVEYRYYQKHRCTNILSPQFKLKEELLTWMIENVGRGTEFVIEQIYYIE